MGPANTSEQDLSAAVGRMADTLAHRGPDDSGAWVDAAAGVALGFRRLSILDLSPAGHQPMASHSGRYVVVFNGEIYNFAALRKELEPLGHAFRGHSDTEVMLAAIESWGLEAAVQKFIGMFAIALWDRETRTLALVRDRLGIKPLYYGWSGRLFLFGSELKALRAHPQFDARVDRGAVALQMRYGYVPAPFSIYQGIKKLPGGCILRCRPGMADAEPSAYWSARDVAARAAAAPFEGSESEACGQLEALLRDSVRLRMIADVPLGAFLSGGIDSSTVVALMQAESSRPVKTFTVGFENARLDEAANARAVAEHLGTEHTELRVTPREALDVIPKLADLYDEPFADSSQIPTTLISALARRAVTVSLSGDGGDELFGGYPRYFLTDRLWLRLRRLPIALRRPVAGMVSALSAETAGRWMGWACPWIDRYGRPAPRGDKISKLAEAMTAPDFRRLYLHFVSQWKQPAALVVGAEEPETVINRPGEREIYPDRFAQMMLWDVMTYLPDDILTKVDRASMSLGLEVRVPVLDHRVVEFAARLPVKMKIAAGQGKWLLRQVLYRFVPRELIDRPKMGFTAPVGDWLRGDLRGWAEELLDENRLRRQGYLQPGPVRRLWREHLAGHRNAEDALWNVLTFQAWRERWEGAAAKTA